MRDRKNYSAQILIVLMLALAIISVLLVLISRNVRRDTIDQIQSEQYENYYSLVEQELLKTLTGNNPNCTTAQLELPLGCNFDLSDLTALGVPASLNIVKDDSSVFNNLVVPKDKNISVNLEGYDGDLEFSWKGQVAWVVNIDYRHSSGEYKTSQSIYDNFSIFAESPVNCINFESTGVNSFRINISQCLSSIVPGGSASYTTIALRMRPLIRNSSSTELTLISPSTLPPQVEVIRATADIDDALPNSPSIQLELQVPKNSPPLDILDYALRTNKIVQKPQSP